MSMYDQVTVVVGIDAKTIEQLEVSHKTWKKHRPEMWRMPWVIFFDLGMKSMDPHEVADWCDGVLQVPSRTLVGWSCEGYETQREAMLSGFPYVAAEHVKTQWWAKVDTDCIATRRDAWPKAEWFDPNAHGRQPVVVAPFWRYTKGRGFLDRLEEWGDATAGLREHPRLNIPHAPDALRVGHPRWCSWNSFYSAEWTRRFVGMLAHTLPHGKLPVPSQDSSMWYAAERAGEFVRNVNMKRAGWDNHSKLSVLRERAATSVGEQHS